ncbi:response regulator [Effusibacillus consociatus]|uniref:Response regulator n=1 Tax=Effusibacillus consociatus TaxID=1117041 RepID=A0ABV9Q7Z9_9BACL
MGQINVLLVEDDPVWLRGLSHFLTTQEDIRVVGQTVSWKEAIELAKQLDVDVVLMDILLGNRFDGLEAAKQIHQSCESKVIMLTSMEEDRIIFDSFRAGAIDYIIKTNFEEIPEAIRAAYHNRSPIRPCVAERIRTEFTRLKHLEQEYKVNQIKSLITPTERMIIGLIYKGYTQAEIAETLVVSIRTVKVHVSNILRKLGEKSSKEVGQKAKEMGII